MLWLDDGFCACVEFGDTLHAEQWKGKPGEKSSLLEGVSRWGAAGGNVPHSQTVHLSFEDYHLVWCSIGTSVLGDSEQDQGM